jgi:hypothetical protein
MRRIDPLPPLLDLPVEPPTTPPACLCRQAPVLDYVVIVPVVALIVWGILKLLRVM